MVKLENPPLVSILINNYNYEKFLKEAIDSALIQTYSPTEVIVVDDGSTDNSREIIRSYGNQIIPIFKSNGGQASAFNAGIEKCRGEVICFLDSDDTFYQNKVEKIVSFLLTKETNNSLVLVYHTLEMIDKNGVLLKEKSPASINNYGSPNLYEHACKYRFFPYPISPTSGFTISRELAQAVFPLPEQGLRISADNFVGRAALLIGEVYGTEQVLGQYRIHGSNHWYSSERIRKASSKEYSLLQDPLLSKSIKNSNPEQYKLLQNEYLNKKLKEHNKTPVVSFFDSIYAAGYYKRFRSSYELFKLSLRAIAWHTDLRTIKFLAKTLIFLGNRFVYKGLNKQSKSL